MLFQRLQTFTVHLVIFLFEFASVLEDECASAAEIFQCGQKEDAALVNGLMSNTKGPSSVR